MQTKKHYDDADINPYIALSDILINLVIVIIIYTISALLLPNISDNLTMKKFEKEINNIDKSYRPEKDIFVKDPQGTQRWRFSSNLLFDKDNELSSQGKIALKYFHVPLNKFKPVDKSNVEIGQPSWKRIRIEGHVQPGKKNQRSDWKKSSDRAIVLAEYLQEGFSNLGIQPNLISVSGRGGQNPILKIYLYHKNNDKEYYQYKNLITNSKCLFSDINTEEELYKVIDKNKHSNLPEIFIIKKYLSGAYEIKENINIDLINSINKDMTSNDRIEIILEYRKTNSTHAVDKKPS